MEEEIYNPNQLKLDLDFGGDEIKTVEQLEEQDRAFISESRIDNSYTRLVWMCTVCGDKLISASNKRHQMDICECGNSGVDLEEGYQRNFGHIMIIKREQIKL